MSGRAVFYLVLSLAWLLLALVILLGWLESVIGKFPAEREWQRYLAAGVCLLMSVWNLLRIYRLSLRKPKTPSPHESPF